MGGYPNRRYIKLKMISTREYSYRMRKNHSATSSARKLNFPSTYLLVYYVHTRIIELTIFHFLREKIIILQNFMFLVLLQSVHYVDLPKRNPKLVSPLPISISISFSQLARTSQCRWRVCTSICVIESQVLVFDLRV